MLTLLITPDHHHDTTRYSTGQIAVADVRASREYLIEDRKLTAEKQAEAASRVPLAYTFDNRVIDSTGERLKRAFTALSTVKKVPDGAVLEQLTRSLADILGVRISTAELVTLLNIRDDSRIVAEIEKSLQKIYRQKVVADRRLFLSDQLTGISVLAADGDKPVDITLDAEPIDLEQARAIFVKTRFSSSVPYEAQQTLKGITAKMLRPSLFYNSEKTDELKASASQAVSPVLIQVKRGEMIVLDGDRVTLEQETKLAAMAAETSLSGRLSSAVGVLGIVLVLLYFPYRFALKNIRKFRPSNKDVLLLAILVTGHFLLIKTLFAIAPTLVVAFPSIDTANYFYLFPFAATAILVRIFVNSEVALVYAAICAPLAGLMFDSLPVVFYAMLGSIIGAHGVRHCDNRSIIFTAGLKVSVVNIALALSFQLFNQSLLTMQTVYCLLFAFAGGIATAAITIGLCPSGSTRLSRTERRSF
ncbi:MAG: hypothetical protein HGB35_08805 [Geobacteraceae bacterium]|nr:hypothetical protein [Geobacteraceae bacterium]